VAKRAIKKLKKNLSEGNLNAKLKSTEARDADNQHKPVNSGFFVSEAY
jgi:hypothetical protein